LRYLQVVVWTVETFDHRVDAELADLPKDVRADFLRIAELLEAYGPADVGMPHVRHLEGKLWEMRLRGRDGIARAIYVVADGQQIVVLHAFTKKTQKTPVRALEIARRRAKELKP
jgi:phage-related protein